MDRAVVEWLRVSDLRAYAALKQDPGLILNMYVVWLTSACSCSCRRIDVSGFCDTVVTCTHPNKDASIHKKLKLKKKVIKGKDPLTRIALNFL